MTYVERQAMAAIIAQKLEHGEQLSADEIKYVTETLNDPLQEFCMREGTFRLVEMIGMEPEEASKLEDEAAEIIRDNIDYADDLYDKFDGELAELKEKMEETK